MTEFELKFEIEPANLKSVAVALPDGEATRQRLQASYFDTAEGALAAHGIVVRLRKEGRRWVQTAKGSTADVLQRLEHNAALPTGLVSALPALDLSRHRGTPVGKLIDKALGLKGSCRYPRLELLYSTDVQRIARTVTYGSSIVEIALDQGRVFCAAQSQAICELEFELKEGIPLDAVKLARQWCAVHGLWLSVISKSMKGQRLSGALKVDTDKSSTSASISRRDGGQDLSGAVMKVCLSQILPNLSEIAGGSKHPEHIHQLRVGIRRLRTALLELSDLTDVVDPLNEAALIRFFKALGDHRDHSHLVLVLQPQWLAVGGPVIDFQPAGMHLPDLGKAARDPELQDAVLGLLAFVHRDLPRPLDKPSVLKKAISVRLNKLYTRALRDGRKFSDLDQTQQHGVRKRFKRLRYLMEFAAPLYPARKVHHMSAALKPVQDALGLYNDELMAIDRLRSRVADDPGTWFGIGWLAGRHEPNINRCQTEIAKFAEMKPFWRNQKDT